MEVSQPLSPGLVSQCSLSCVQRQNRSPENSKILWFLSIYLIFMCVSMHNCALKTGSGHQMPLKQELPDMGAGNQTRVFCKSRKRS